MTDRVTVGNLRVAQVLYDFINNEALPGTDIDPDSFWAGVDKVVADLTPRTRNCSPAVTTCRPRSTSGTASASSSRSIPRLQAVPHRDRLPAARARRLHHHHRRRRRRDHHDRGSRSWWSDPQRPVRAQRRQRPLGFAVRRAVRHRRDPRGRRRREGHQLQQGARRQGHRLRAPVPRWRRTAGVRSVERGDRPQDRRRLS